MTLITTLNFISVIKLGLNLWTNLNQVFRFQVSVESKGYLKLHLEKAHAKFKTFENMKMFYHVSEKCSTV